MYHGASNKQRVRSLEMGALFAAGGASLYQPRELFLVQFGNIASRELW